MSTNLSLLFYEHLATWNQERTQKGGITSLLETLKITDILGTVYSYYGEKQFLFLPPSLEKFPAHVPNGNIS